MKIATSSTDLTKSRSGVHNWDNSCEISFKCLKFAIIQAPILICTDCRKPFGGHVEASKIAVGCILSKLNKPGEIKRSHFPKKLSPTE